jgi:Tyrosine phosphatase family
MDAPQLPPPPTPPAPPPRRFSRRALFKLAGAGVVLASSAEAARVLLGSNEHTVIPGKVYRSAQLSREKLERVIAEKKIRTVINLRGCCPDMDWYMGDARATSTTGINQEDIALSAKRHPPPSEIRRLIEVFDRTEYPVIIHCARGADRTGLASAIAILLQPDSGLATARLQLWPRYGHFAVGRTAVLDSFLDAYETALAARGETHSPARFREWVANEYCPGPFRAELSVIAPAPLSVPTGVGFVVTVRVVNRSVEPWQFATGGSGGVRLRYTLHAKTGEFIYRGHAGLFRRTVYPGESIDLAAGFPPIKVPGPHVLHADMLDAQPIDLLDTDFAQYGSEPLIVGLDAR